jgi:hypothetical protein
LGTPLDAGLHLAIETFPPGLLAFEQRRALQQLVRIMDIAMTQLDVSYILRYTGVVVEVVGEEWLRKEIVKAHEKAKPKKVRKFKHSMEP